MSKQTSIYAGMPFDNILKCVHCGLCLDSCPTYRELGAEQDSPRGRLYLMRGLWEGELQPTPDVIAPLDRCIDCRACESACPSGVPYGELLEKTRGVLVEHRPASVKRTFLEQFFLQRVLRSTPWLVFFSFVGKFASKCGLDRLPQSGFAKFLPATLRRGLTLLPNFAGASFKRKFKGEAHQGAVHHRVGLFTGCIMDVADHEIHAASVKLLQAAGCQVVIPQEQGCCGALAVHAGSREAPREMARANRAAFGEGLDAILVNAAGCGAQLKEYHHLFAECEENTEDWKAFGSRVVDVLSFLARQPLASDNAAWEQEPVTVLYDAPCHLMHAQGDDATPRAFMAELPGVNLIPLCEADRCCGAGGVYNMMQPELSDKVLDRKLDDLIEMMGWYPEARILLTANPGCLYQLRMGCKRRGLDLQVMHPVTLAAQRLRNT